MAEARKTTSRKPRTAARAASRPATSRRTVEPDVAEEASAAQAQEADADGYVTALLCDEELQIIPPSLWRASWASLLAGGQIAAFVELTVHPDDLDLFWEIDPTNEQFGEFIQDATRQGGESQGNSRGPATSPRSTRRR